MAIVMSLFNILNNTVMKESFMSYITSSTVDYNKNLCFLTHTDYIYNLFSIIKKGNNF